MRTVETLKIKPAHKKLFACYTKKIVHINYRYSVIFKRILPNIAVKKITVKLSQVFLYVFHCFGLYGIVGMLFHKNIFDTRWHIPILTCGHKLALISEEC